MCSELPLKVGTTVAVLAPPETDGLQPARVHGRRGRIPASHIKEVRAVSSLKETS